MYSPHHILYNALNFSQEIMVMSRKTDRRTLYTKAQIKKAYVEALHHKPMDKITVSELCKTSEINRSTFYLHYQDTYAVLEELLNEVLDSIEIPQKDFFQGGELHWDITESIYQSLLDEPDKIFLLDKGLSYPPFVKKFVEWRTRGTLSYYRVKSSLPDEDLYLILNSFYLSYITADKNYSENHSLEELAHFNQLLNHYLYEPMHKALLNIEMGIEKK